MLAYITAYLGGVVWLGA